ncbi:FHA domain-containing protein [Cardiosporidium cionae]|uniref:FHA domain-containing protein n=1 Tax=Cardiosporidium cionae TaxID=476202 RepID=A0ABQ7JD16_9APIC|nr:FHA domain-containing protein [Cardiosporidium cionae]|eukprot:KAF8821885.1 FHA domain-containing protein [Cardiosporidium cionae]
MARLSLRGLLPNSPSTSSRQKGSKVKSKSSSSFAKTGRDLSSTSLNAVSQAAQSSQPLSCSVSKSVHESDSKLPKFDGRFTRLDSFTGAYHWLSLEYPCPVYFRDHIYPSALHAVLIAQYPHVDFEEMALLTTHKELQNFVREKEELAEWPKIRLKIMENIMRDKFRRNEALREKLRDTGQRELIWNNKEDAFFGQIDFRGQNNLGRILQAIRNNILDDTELDSWLVLCHDIELDRNARPTIRLTECKEGSTEKKIHELSGRPYYRIGKLPNSDVVALNPSISRRHALISIQKDGRVLLFDLCSKSKTYRNGKPLILDHTPEPLFSGDCITLGTSSRQYIVEIDNSNVLSFFQRKQRELRREISKMSVDISDPLGLSIKCQTKVFVAGLSFKTTQDDLQEFFQSCGSIKSIQIPQGFQKQVQQLDSNENQARRGIAFVEFDKAASARIALEKDGRSLKGRVIKVLLADLSKKERLQHNSEQEPSNDFPEKNGGMKTREYNSWETSRISNRHSKKTRIDGIRSLRQENEEVRYRSGSVKSGSSKTSSSFSTEKEHFPRRNEKHQNDYKALLSSERKRNKCSHRDKKMVRRGNDCARRTHKMKQRHGKRSVDRHNREHSHRNVHLIRQADRSCRSPRNKQIVSLSKNYDQCKEMHSFSSEASRNDKKYSHHKYRHRSSSSKISENDSNST